MSFKSLENLKLENLEKQTVGPLISSELLVIAQSIGEADVKLYELPQLLESIESENLHKFAVLLSCGSFEINAKLEECDGGTLLHNACQKGFLGAVHLLTVSGAQLDIFDREQNSPLMLAISYLKNDVVRYLIKAGASITIKGTDGMTALHIAAKHGNLRACELLLEAALCARDYIDLGDDGGWTPLVWACEHGHKEVAKVLLAKGADAHVRDVEHNVALHWAAFSDSGDISEVLLNNGCDVNAFNVHGETPLHIAARQDNYNTALILLIRGADINLTNKLGETPLDCASSSGKCYNAIALNVHFSGLATTGSLKKILLSNDISKGRESNPIQCINSVDCEQFPADFVYVSKNCFTADIQIDQKVINMQSCCCEDRCLSGSCECTSNSSRCWYDDEGKLVLDFDFFDPPMIFECNQTCACNAITCSNRVVQHGLTQRFQVYKTENKGWALRTLKSITRGTYVCEYVGEIISDTEAELRDDDSYIFDLNNQTSLGKNDCNAYCIDAKYYGNFARFINHSCEPNLFPDDQ